MSYIFYTYEEEDYERKKATASRIRFAKEPRKLMTNNEIVELLVKGGFQAESWEDGIDTNASMEDIDRILPDVPEFQNLQIRDSGEVFSQTIREVEWLSEWEMRDGRAE